MFEQVLAIIRNTFFESIRQPILLILMVIATLALVLSNSLSGYTMDDDDRMMIDLGLSSVFLIGTLASAFIATNVLTREIENKTALTVISKPVGRPLFVVGKFLGVAGALTVATLFMSFGFLLVEMHGVQQTARDPYHGPVLLFGLGALGIAIAVGVWSNYFYNKVFASTALCVATPLLGVAYVLCLLFDHDWSRTASIGEVFKPDLWLALIALLTAILVLTSIAIAASTRLGQVMTLVVTLGVFLVGMLSDAMFGAPAHRIEQSWVSRAEEQGLTYTETIVRSIPLVGGEVQTEEIERVVPTVAPSSLAQGGERIAQLSYRTAYSIIPNFQVLWLADALTQRRVIPREYMVKSVSYGVLNMTMILGVAVILFQRREVG